MEKEALHCKGTKEVSDGRERLRRSGACLRAGEMCRQGRSGADSGGLSRRSRRPGGYYLMCGAGGGFGDLYVSPDWGGPTPAGDDGPATIHGEPHSDRVYYAADRRIVICRYIWVIRGLRA
jgi:hypothetical protein